MLDVVAPHVSEIIAIINDCTDNTQAILESYQAKIIEHTWMGMTQQKNITLSHATQPWVFNLDADEVPSPELMLAIDGIMQSNPADIQAYSIPRLSYFLGKWIKHGDWYPDRVTRLFRRESGSFVGNTGHEKVHVRGKIKKIKADLYHYSFPTLASMISKLAFFGQAFLHTQQARNQKFTVIQAIARAYWRFFRCYIIRLGFLDGYVGFYIANYQYFYTLYRYTCLLEHQIQTESKMNS